MVQPQIFHWRSIHEFTPVAVKDIIKAFHARKPENEGMKCTFNPKTQTFTLEGQREVAENAFHDLVEVLGMKIGKEESKRRQKISETDINIRRVPATLMNARSLQWTEHPVDEDEDGFRKDFTSFVALTEEDEPAEFEITRKWLPKQKSTFADCFHRGGKDLTIEVARLCGVVIASDWIDHELKIGANDEESYERAVRKLEKIEANFLKPFTAKTAHLFNGEKMNRFELLLLPLAKQKSTFLQTTMFPSDSWLGAEIVVTKKSDKSKGTNINPRLFTVRMAKYDPEIDNHVNVTVNMGPVHSAYQTESSRDWIGFTYSEHSRIENDNETVLSDDTQITAEPVAAEAKAPQLRQLQTPSLMQTDPSTGGLLLGPRPTSLASESRVTTTATHTVESAAPRRVARVPRGAAAGGSGQPPQSTNQSTSAMTSTTLSTTAGETPGASIRNGRALSENSSNSSSTSGRPGGVPLSSAMNSRSMASRSELASSEMASSEMATASSIKSEASYDRSDLDSVDSYETNPHFGLGFAGDSYRLQQQGFGSQANSTNHRQQAHHNSVEQTGSTFGMGFNESTHSTGIGFQLGNRPSGNKGKAEPQTLSDGSRVPVATRRVRSTKTNPATSTTATTSDASVVGSSTAGEPKNVKYIMSGKLALDLIKKEEVKNSSSSKKEQQKPEYETRRYMNTMNQKAPPRRNKNEEDPQVIAAHKQQVLQAVFGNGFDRARTLKGRVKFEATIGRIVFCDIPKKLTRNHRFTWKKFEEEVMPNKENCFFTDMVSSRHWDAEFVADIKFKGSKDMFGAIDTATVTYVFECEGVLDSKFIIEVDAATHEGKVYDHEEPLGTVYYHCPARSWDSKILLTHSTIRDDREESLHALLEALEIPQGKSVPDISFRTNRMDFRIARITVRRELIREFTPDCTTESSCSSPFLLVTTEIQELRIQRNKFHRGLFRAHPYPDMIERNKLWYNFTIRSKDIDKCLVDNLNLELGEDTYWTTTGILKYGGVGGGGGHDNGGKEGGDGESEILRGMQEVLGNLIKRIDDVGYDNTQFTSYGVDIVDGEEAETEYMDSVVR